MPHPQTKSEPTPKTTSDPCWHTKAAIQRIAAGERTTWRDWYALVHIPRCGQCRHALEAMKTYFQAIQALKDQGNKTAES